MKRVRKKLRIAVFLFLIITYRYAGQQSILALDQNLISEIQESKTDNEEEKKISPTELDLGDYQSEMEVGSRQLLMVTVLPQDATNQTLSYSSSNTAVASINGMGRITAHAVGTTEISVTCEGITGKFTLTVTEKKEEAVIPPTEIDLGEYQTEMKVGEKQLLGVTVLPADATEQTITYLSSNTAVATINGMGRITALSVGETTIYVSCGSINTFFTLTVKPKEEEQIPVTDLDIGDCPESLEIGSSQVLSVTPIPTDATNQECSYKSSNEKIVTVNEIGRITGVALGKAKITVTCGTVKKTFIIEVTEKSEQEIPVEDIEISAYEEDLEVEKTMTLSAKVLPSDATDSELTYESSNETIATVNSSGEVKGIKEGTVTITLRAGKIKKKVTLNIITPTEGIIVNETYLVLQPGETCSLSAKAQPAQAPQSITYHTDDSKVATVGKNGFVTAVASGSTSILVSNGESMTAVTVIVNEPVKEKTEDSESTIKKSGDKIYPNELMVSEYANISKEMLQYYYEEKEIVTVQGNGYTYSFRGEDIVNYHNEFHTELIFKETEQGTTFVLNEGKPLFGTIQMSLDREDNGYLYLYNPSKEKYELLQQGSLHNLTLDTPGTYLLTEKKLGNGSINVIVLIGSTVIVVILAGGYIVIKKKYWFW